MNKTPTILLILVMRRIFHAFKYSTLNKVQLNKRNKNQTPQKNTGKSCRESWVYLFFKIWKSWVCLDLPGCLYRGHWSEKSFIFLSFFNPEIFIFFLNFFFLVKYFSSSLSWKQASWANQSKDWRNSCLAKLTTYFVFLLIRTSTSLILFAKSFSISAKKKL